MVNALLVFLGSGFGGALRYLFGGAVQRWHGGPFPLGTLAVNLSGCFAMGLASAALAARAPLREEYRLALLVGVLGGFTTFSAFGGETYDLVKGGHHPHAALNVALHVAAGLAAVWLGHRVGESWL